MYSVKGFKATTQKELDSIKALLKKNGYGWMDFTTKDTYHMTVGNSVTWKNVFKSAATGDMVDVRVTVTKLDGFTIPKKKQNVLIQLRSNMRYAILGDDGGMAHFKTEFLKAGTNTPINLSAIVGFGDVDAHQILMFPKYDAKLIGRNLSEGTDKFGNKGFTSPKAVENEDQKNHAWFLVNGSSFDFGYNNPAKYKNVTGRDNQQYNGSWFQMGGIDLKVSWPKAPTAPNPVLLANPQKPTAPKKPVAPTKPEEPTISGTHGQRPKEPQKPAPITKPEYEPMPEVHYHQNILLEPTVTTSKVKLTKTSNGVVVPNAVYNIFNKEGHVVDTLTTDKNGSDTSIDLAFGTYTIQEVEAPNGLELDPVIHTIKLDDSKPVFDLAVSDTSKRVMPKTGSQKLIVLGIIASALLALIPFVAKKKAR